MSYVKSEPGYSVDDPDYVKYEKEYNEYVTRSLLCENMVRLNEDVIKKMETKLSNAVRDEERKLLERNVVVLSEIKYDWAKLMQSHDAKKDEAWQNRCEAIERMRQLKRIKKT